MSDIKLFRTQGDDVEELKGTSVALERSSQTLIERRLETFLGIRFLVSEHYTGSTHNGRIDTLGIDENNVPVIIEYKRALNENVITQGLFYLDWLMDHKADFRWLVLERYGREVADAIEWSSPRLICIAGDFTTFDEHAAKQIRRSIELIRYRRYSDEFLLLELVNAISEPESNRKVRHTATIESGAPSATETASQASTQGNERDELFSADNSLTDRYEALKAFLLALGDDVQVKPLKHYVAFRRIKNFTCVAPQPRIRALCVWVKVNPDSIALEPGFTRDVRRIGHHGTGDLEIMLRTADDLERAKPLLVRSYESS